MHKCTRLPKSQDQTRPSFSLFHRHSHIWGRTAAHIAIKHEALPYKCMKRQECRTALGERDVVHDTMTTRPSGFTPHRLARRKLARKLHHILYAALLLPQRNAHIKPPEAPALHDVDHAGLWAEILACAVSQSVSQPASQSVAQALRTRTARLGHKSRWSCALKVLNMNDTIAPQTASCMKLLLLNRPELCHSQRTQEKAAHCLLQYCVMLGCSLRQVNQMQDSFEVGFQGSKMTACSGSMPWQEFSS